MRVVAWRDVFRVVDELGHVLMCCQTRDEAEMFIAGQP
jgi:hypothetical protein